MLFAFSIAPSGAGAADETGSVSAAVADAVRVVRESGLPNETTSMFTTIEGEWGECMQVIKDACDAMAAHSDRVGLVLKADLRPGFTGQLTSKVDRVEAHLDEGERGTR
ncbi:thiamine-binding protein [Ornithinimicrobium sp. Arc0846-15]|nr:thiamine-binding protein [Ornithinimicrobium laminariae]